MPKLGFVHTILPLVDYFDRLAEKELPGVERLHILDEPLLKRVMERGHLLPADTERLAGHVETAADAGAQAVLVTCSTLSPCVEDLRQQGAALPVFKIDEAMFDDALRRGRVIGILATNPATMRPTREGLLATARLYGLEDEIDLEEKLVEEALEALKAGDSLKHDAIIAQAGKELASRCDVVIFAQASMARAASKVPEPERRKILTSPETALGSVAALLKDER